MTLINVRKNAFFVGLTLINDHANLRYVICCSALISCNKVALFWHALNCCMKVHQMIYHMTVMTIDLMSPYINTELALVH